VLQKTYYIFLFLANRIETPPDPLSEGLHS